MNKSRLVIAIILVLTLLTTWDVYANRMDVFDGWVQGFSVPPRTAQGEVKHAQRHGQEAHDAGGAAMIIIKTNHGSVKVTGADTAEVTVDYGFTVGAETDAQAGSYLDRLALAIAPGDNKALVVDFVEPSVRPRYIQDVQAALEITVPAGVSVLVDGQSSVEVRGVEGDANVVSTGATRVANIGGNASVNARPGREAIATIGQSVHELEGSPVEIRAIGGNLSLSASFCDVTIDGVGGDLKTNVTGAKCEVSGVMGAVDLTERMAAVTLADPGGKVDADCTSGSLYMTGVQAPVTVNGRMALVRIQPARGAGYDIRAELSMSMLFSDYELQTDGDARFNYEASGWIGDGENQLRVALNGGTLEIRKP